MVALIVTWVVFLIGFLVLAKAITKLEKDIISLALAIVEDFQRIDKDIKQNQKFILDLKLRVKALEVEKDD